ncbi:glycerophosphodiester phosphodiesterase [Lishizhenia sp.]|uniref:glycerophosphodiester phosphodiesterase n=1 Tax=Lishizhenia sp. TaxID=2497594 RepID=UPI00299D1F84|nr:glycerophosphodiester phosphodiesterase family protein [Lishizhenia sp.]MDX1447002.1 glycerophosphodiester phosphodiesterase family protein [Lishizhenia sp.]
MRFSLILLLILVSACEKAKFSDVAIISHAGAGITAIHSPYIDNSLEAVNYALSFEACAGVELDIQFSKDSSMWVFHDADLKKKFDDALCISSYTDKELSQLELKNGEALICLNEFDFSRYPNKSFYLDIKHWNNCGLYGQEVLMRGLEKMNWQSVGAANIHLLMTQKSWLDSVITHYEKVMYIVNSDENLDEILTQHPGLYGVEVKYSATTNTEIEKLKAQGLHVGIFQTRAAKTIRNAINLHPDFIETDDFKTAINIVSNGK